ncbi:MAG: acetate--CoA ligase family protein, partial [Methanosarcinales archaeon]
KVILGYVEGIKNGQEFIKIAREVSKIKPIIIIKSGRTSEGSKAVSSHTGTLAGSDKAYDAAFLQSGVIRANSVEELFDFAIAFSYQPIPKGNRIAILTNAGGPGIMATDSLSLENLKLSSFETTTINKLRQYLPKYANIYNPVDVLGDASEERYDFAIKTVLQDNNVDGIIVLVSPQAMTNIKEIAKVIIKYQGEKPILCCFLGGKTAETGKKILIENKIPNYPFPERAAKTMHTLYKYSEIKNKSYKEPPVFKVNKALGKKILNNAKDLGKKRIGVESMEILRAYDIPISNYGIATTLNKAIETADRIGYPVVLKIISPDILHKTDFGGVITNIKNKEELIKYYNKLLFNIKKHFSNAKILGVLVQEMVFNGTEVIIGMNKDAQFGPMLMFGLGGIYVDVLKDVSWRIAPINEKDARDMVKEIKAYPLLKGVRGEEPLDINAIIDCLLRVSQISVENPEIVELDINPLLVFNKGVKAVDFRATLQI